MTDIHNLAFHSYGPDFQSIIRREGGDCSLPEGDQPVTVDALRTNFPEHASRIFSDIDGADCVAGAGTLKSEYEAHLSTCVDAAAIPAFHDVFCRKFPLVGKVIAFEAMERFGHVMQMNAFKRFVAKPNVAAGASNRPPRSGFLGPPPAAVLASKHIISVLTAKLGDELVRPDGGAIWCFRPENKLDEPFFGQSLELLPCRLGLKAEKETDGDDPNWVAFAVSPPPTIWRAPTFADVTWAFLTDWMPGGWTWPSPTFVCGAGFREALGNNLVYRQLQYAAGPFPAAWPTAPATKFGPS